MIKNVVIIGGGPSGCTLAAYLARAGINVIIFSIKTRPELIIGESLVPAVLPYLQELGIEDEVRLYSTYKPGATFFIDSDHNEVTFYFDHDKKELPQYAYNFPRDRFDDTLIKTAIKSGAKLIHHRVKLKKVANSNRILLDDDSLAAAGDCLKSQPDYIVDATGRSGLISKLLTIPTKEGTRKDTALFAHLDKAEITHKGHVHVDRLNRGWCWRIPLPNRVSVGFVAPADYLKEIGKNKEDQFDTLIKENPIVREFSRDSKRITRVMKYTNYQRVSSTMNGKNWALAGDAVGFIDPVFSSGLLIAISSGKFLSDAILKGTEKAFLKYKQQMSHQLESWQRVIDYFYDGRLFTLFRVGGEFKKTPIGRLIDPHINKHFSRVFTGIATTNFYSFGLVQFLIKYGLRGEDYSKIRIR